MAFNKKLCPACMNTLGEESVCPVCGFDLSSEQNAPFLPYGTLIAEKYYVGEVLEQNGDGITYIGLDTVSENTVRIREFFPQGICSRNAGETDIFVGADNERAYGGYFSEFLNLWHKLGNLQSIEGIIRVIDVFESNGTAYAICEADGSMTLNEYLNENGGRLDRSQINSMLMPVFDAVETLQNMGIFHGGISPDTLFLSSGGFFKLWGFSVPDVRRHYGGLLPDVRAGYAAVEQYNRGFSMGAYTDVYALGAVLYRCLTAHDPVDSMMRIDNDTLALSADDARIIPANSVNAIIAAMYVMPSSRTATVAEFRAGLSGATTVSVLHKQDDTDDGPPPLIDELSSIDESELYEADKAPNREAPFVVNNSPDFIPVLTDTKGVREGIAVSTAVIMSACVALVMLIFFACLSLTGIVSFDLSGTGKSAHVVEMPDFSGKAKTDPAIAQAAEEYDLHIILQPDYSEGVEQNVIFEQSIAAGTKAAVGSELILKYSSGAATVTIPNFVGIPFTEAVYYIGKLNLTYNIVERTNDGSGTPGYVASINPGAGSTVYEGTEIAVEIWGDAPASSGSEITSSTSILDSVFGRFQQLFN